jgi:hypothetical protein
MKVVIDIPDNTKFIGISYAVDNGNLTITAGTRAYTNIKDGDEYTIEPTDDGINVKEV